jgi:dienelactone hydrolase
VRVHGGVLSLSATFVGSGTRGVVFSNQSDNDLCAWVPLAKRLVRSGFRVALYDYSGAGAYPDTLAVAAALRHRGASRVALVGASEGAKSSIAAAARAHAAAVVSISPERDLDGFGDVLPAARRLTAPVLYLYAKGDPLADLNAPQLYAATREKNKQVASFPGYDHGTALLTHPTVPGLIERFLKRAVR